jgi:hypothetical protein
MTHGVAERARPHRGAARSAPRRVARAAARRGDHARALTSAVDRVVPSDPLASQLARAVSTRAGTTIDSPLLQRFALVRANDTAYPEPKHRGHGAAPTHAAPGEDFFVHQVKGNDGRWFDDQNEAILEGSIDADLFMADSGKMAIDATAGGEAKAFFATKDVFRAGDAALQGGVRLAKTDRYLWNAKLKERLYEIVPTVGKGNQQQTGVDVRGPQNCNTMATTRAATPGSATPVPTTRCTSSDVQRQAQGPVVPADAAQDPRLHRRPADLVRVGRAPDRLIRPARGSGRGREAPMSAGCATIPCVLRCGGVRRSQATSSREVSA